MGHPVYCTALSLSTRHCGLLVADTNLILDFQAAALDVGHSVHTTWFDHAVVSKSILIVQKKETQCRYLYEASERHTPDD